MNWLERRKELDTQRVELYLQCVQLEDHIKMLEKRKTELFYDATVEDLLVVRQAIDAQIVDAYIRVSALQQQIEEIDRIKQLELKQLEVYGGL